MADVVTPTCYIIPSCDTPHDRRAGEQLHDTPLQCYVYGRKRTIVCVSRGREGGREEGGSEVIG